MYSNDSDDEEEDEGEDDCDNNDDDAEDGPEIEDGFGPSLDYGRPRRLPSAATV